MQKPHYVFLKNQNFVLALTDEDNAEITLIYPFDTSRQIKLEGIFANLLLKQLHLSQANNDKDEGIISSLHIIEKQHPWLMGIADASLVPASTRQTLIGDALGLLFLEITDVCNERCIHCYASSSPECKDFLSLDEIKSVLLQARSLGRPFVQFTGGDPLIHRHLVEAVAFADSLDVQGIEIYTNGLLLNETLLQSLLPFGPDIAFSLYSADADVHDGITQVPGSFKRTVAAIHRAQDMGFTIRIGMAVMQQNAGHEALMLDFAKAEFFLHASSVRFDAVHETGRGKTLNTQHITFMATQGSHVPSTKGHDGVDHADQANSDQANAGQANSDQANSDQAKTTAYASTTSIANRRGKLAVCANGQVSPCIFNRSHQLGSIREQSLLDILSAEHTCQGNLSPSIRRWNQCQQQLSCADCQMVAYTLGDNI